MKSASQLRPIIVYFRISKKDRTTENQEWAMERHLRSLAGPVEVVREQGSNWRKPLPMLTEIEKRVAAGRVGELHLYRVCRSGRDHETDVRLWNSCVKHRTRLVFVDEDLDSSREDDRERFYQLSCYAERERRMISRRVKDAFSRLKAKDPNWRVGGRPTGVLNRTTRSKTEAILKLWDSGMARWSIKAATGVSWATVNRVLVQEGRLKE